MQFYPIESDPGNVRVGGDQHSGQGSVGVHQPVAQASLHAPVNGGPGHGGSVQLETLRQQDREVSGSCGQSWWVAGRPTLTGRAAVRGSAADSMQ